jgi:hypothetical protein
MTDTAPVKLPRLGSASSVISTSSRGGHAVKSPKAKAAALQAKLDDKALITGMRTSEIVSKHRSGGGALSTFTPLASIEKKKSDKLALDYLEKLRSSLHSGAREIAKLEATLKEQQSKQVLLQQSLESINHELEQASSHMLASSGNLHSHDIDNTLFEKQVLVEYRLEELQGEMASTTLRLKNIRESHEETAAELGNLADFEELITSKVTAVEETERIIASMHEKVANQNRKRQISRIQARLSRHKKQVSEELHARELAETLASEQQNRTQTRLRKKGKKAQTVRAHLDQDVDEAKERRLANVRSFKSSLQQAQNELVLLNAERRQKKQARETKLDDERKRLEAAGKNPDAVIRSRHETRKIKVHSQKLKRKIQESEMIILDKLIQEDSSRRRVSEEKHQKNLDKLKLLQSIGNLGEENLRSYMESRLTTGLDTIDPTGRMYKIHPSKYTKMRKKQFGLGKASQDEVESEKERLAKVKADAANIAKQRSKNKRKDRGKRNKNKKRSPGMTKRSQSQMSRRSTMPVSKVLTSPSAAVENETVESKRPASAKTAVSVVESEHSNIADDEDQYDNRSDLQPTPPPPPQQHSDVFSSTGTATSVRSRRTNLVQQSNALRAVRATYELGKQQEACGRKHEGDAFRCTPSHIEFTDYDLDVELTKTISICNVSLTFNSFRPLPLAEDVRNVLSVDFQPAGRLAAGMSNSLTVKLLPREHRDIDTEVVLAAPTGKFVIPIVCRCKKATPVVEQQTIELGDTTVGNATRRLLNIKNDGALHLRYHCDVQWSDDSVVDPSVFSMPSSGIVRSYEQVNLPCIATPTIRESHVGKLDAKIVVSFEPVDIVEQADGKDIRLITKKVIWGSQSSYNIPLSGTLSDVDVQMKSVETEANVCTAGNVYRTQSFVVNHGKSARKIHLQVPKQLKHVLSCNPLTGFAQPGEDFPVYVRFRADDALLAALHSIDPNLVQIENGPLYDPTSENLLEKFGIVSQACENLPAADTKAVDLADGSLEQELEQDAQSQPSDSPDAKAPEEVVVASNAGTSPSTDSLDCKHSDDSLASLTSGPLTVAALGRMWGKVARIRIPLEVSAERQDALVPFSICATIVGGHMHYSVAKLDFGSCWLGSSTRLLLTIVNNTPLLQNIATVDMPSELEVFPGDGLINVLPYSFETRSVAFTPKIPQPYRATLSLQSALETRHIPVSGTSQRAPVMIRHPHMRIEPVPAGETVHIRSFVDNASRSSWAYQLQDVELEPELAKYGVRLDIQPKVGWLRPKSSKRFEISITHTSPAQVADATTDSKEAASANEANADDAGGMTDSDAQQDEEINASCESDAAAVLCNVPSSGFSNSAEQQGALVVMNDQLSTQRLLTVRIPCALCERARSALSSTSADNNASNSNQTYTFVELVIPLADRLIRSEPASLDFGAVWCGERRVLRTRIMCDGPIAAPLTYLDGALNDASPYVVLNALRETGGGKHYDLVVAFEPTQKRVFKANIVLRCQGTKQQLTIPLRGRGTEGERSARLVKHEVEADASKGKTKGGKSKRKDEADTKNEDEDVPDTRISYDNVMVGQQLDGGKIVVTNHGKHTLHSTVQRNRQESAGRSVQQCNEANFHFEPAEVDVPSGEEAHIDTKLVATTAGELCETVCVVGQSFELHAVCHEANVAAVVSDRGSLQLQILAHPENVEIIPDAKSTAQIDPDNAVVPSPECTVRLIDPTLATQVTLELVEPDNKSSKGTGKVAKDKSKTKSKGKAGKGKGNGKGKTKGKGNDADVAEEPHDPLKLWQSCLEPESVYNIQCHYKAQPSESSDDVTIAPPESVELEVELKNVVVYDAEVPCLTLTTIKRRVFVHTVAHDTE